MNLNTNAAVRAPEAFTGQLNANEVFSTLFNMLISQRVFSDNIKGLYSSLVNRYKTDGGLYGDTKTFTATDCLETSAWGGDDEAANLLALNRPKNPSTQKVVVDQFRKCWLTVDNYLSKRAWSDEGTFAQFQSTMLGWVAETKKIYESKLFNAFVGTVNGGASVNSLSVSYLTGATAASDIEAQNRINAQKTATAIADLMDDMKDAERVYNDYGYMRSYDPSDLVFVYNAKFANEITLLDLPSLFHKEGLGPVSQEKLPAKYFGTIITSSNVSSYTADTPTAGKPIKTSDKKYTPGTANANGCIRSLYECDVTVSSVAYHLMPGDEIPAGTVIDSAAAAGTLAYNTVYINDANVICKILHKNSIPFMSAFETATEFWNPRSLTSNHYLIWGYSELTYLKNYPLITLQKA